MICNPEDKSIMNSSEEKSELITHSIEDNRQQFIR